MQVRWMGVAIAGLAGCGGVEVGPADSDAAGGAQADAAPTGEVDARPVDAATPPGDAVVLLYDFEAPLIQEGAELFVPDESGNDHRGAVTPGTVPGAVTVVARSDGAGNALMFPAPCPMDCPRVYLEARGTEQLNPGEADFAVSLDLLVPADAPGDENVAQKGFYDGAGGQWKIELGVDLRPVCIFRYGAGETEFISVGLSEPINDAEWHTFRCSRRGGELEARLDGGLDDDQVRQAPIPDGVTLAIDNPDTILIGGQAGGASSDQFYGILDNVKVEIFPPR